MFMAPTLTTEIGPGPVVRAAGELDLSTAARLCHVIASVDARRVTIDLTELTFCDSTGLRALVGAVREIEIRGGRASVLVAADGMLERLLDMTGLGEFLSATVVV
jgi:anti-sigma B factor antagonist